MWFKKKKCLQTTPRGFNYFPPGNFFCEQSVGLDLNWDCVANPSLHRGTPPSLPSYLRRHSIPRSSSPSIKGNPWELDKSWMREKCESRRRRNNQNYRAGSMIPPVNQLDLAWTRPRIPLPRNQGPPSSRLRHHSICDHPRAPLVLPPPLRRSTCLDNFNPIINPPLAA